jgi:hypothetical protein
MGAKLFRGQNVLAHDLEFVRVIAEIAAAGANHYVKIDGDAVAHGGDQSEARSNAAFDETAA